MEIHYWWVGLSCILVLMLRGAQAAAVEPTTDEEHDFDLGPLRCCPRPKVSETCPGMSNYIPCTIASEMERRENRISSQLGTFPSFVENCTESARKILCEQNFPTCEINPDGSHEVLLPSRNACEQKLEDTCSPWFPDELIEQTCSLYEPTSANYSVRDCSAANITFNHCTVDWYVPEWILQYVKQIDMELDIARSSSLEFLNKNCWEKLKAVRCKSVGRCWALGDRLEHIISTETCNEALSCLDDNNQEIFRATLGCNLLPSERNRLVTDPTDITLTIATKPPATTQPSTTVPNNTPTLPLIDNSSTSVSSASILLILLTLTISLLVS